MAYCPVGQVGEIEVGGRTIRVRNPGPRWVLRAQDESTTVTGRLSPLEYVSRILDELVVEPELTIDDFANEAEVVEFLREFNRMRDPGDVDTWVSEPYCPKGKAVQVRIGELEFQLVNPGVRWVMQAQEECTLPNGLLSIGRYAERVMRECVTGRRLTLEDFRHENEVLEFLRIFRRIRQRSAQSPAEGKEAEVD